MHDENVVHHRNVPWVRSRVGDRRTRARRQRRRDRPRHLHPRRPRPDLRRAAAADRPRRHRPRRGLRRRAAGARSLRPARRRHQQRRLRPLRLRRGAERGRRPRPARDELLRCALGHTGGAADHARAGIGPHHPGQLDRRHLRVPDRRRLPRVEVGARGSEPVARPGGRALRHHGHAHRARRLLDRLGRPVGQALRAVVHLRRDPRTHPPRARGPQHLRPRRPQGLRGGRARGRRRRRAAAARLLRRGPALDRQGGLRLADRDLGEVGRRVPARAGLTPATTRGGMPSRTSVTAYLLRVGWRPRRPRDLRRVGVVLLGDRHRTKESRRAPILTHRPPRPPRRSPRRGARDGGSTHGRRGHRPVSRGLPDRRCSVRRRSVRHDDRAARRPARRLLLGRQRHGQLRGAQLLPLARQLRLAGRGLEPRELGDPSTKSATYSIDPARHPDQKTEWLRRAQNERLCGVPTQPDFAYTYTFVAGVGVGGLYTGTVSCQLVARPQIDAITPDTDYVFVTVGGNDIGFSTIVVDCLTLRDPSSCKQALDDATATAPQMVERTKDALRAVEQKSGGHAPVYLLSYPFLINTESYGIPEAAPVYDAGTALNNLQRLGDDLQARGIAELDAEPGADNYHFVDTVKAAWGGRVHGLDPHVVADNSQAWLVPVGTPGRDTAEFVHPTQPGWDATAGALRVAVTG